MFLVSKKYTSCGICGGKIDQNDSRLITTACYHNFHRGCLLRWLFDNNCNCPTCSKPLKSK